jgi:hypothetical protein
VATHAAVTLTAFLFENDQFRTAGLVRHHNRHRRFSCIVADERFVATNHENIFKGDFRTEFGF